ncbi:YkvA family protein [Caldinitratiruptor microaerophilus]|uniref:DUF1232 domain-containing protein n=1 Tax=Caldinitratiruptor microaerophilus TaxID=671077 RepID=A0AA35G9P0_9FIRM|nr:DUF1232 domain-containing protein [Caldinitratiruptor microaerophilus]BDG62405.1 hypothetical protein caldi_34950 [Caldinitratiruptor microaerophilus]
MRVSELEVRLAPADIRQLLQSLVGPGARVTIEAVAVEDARLRVRLRPAALPVPIEVQAHIRRVDPGELVLGLDIGAMGLLPAAWRTRALDLLSQRLDAPGVKLTDGQLHIAAATLAGPLATACRLSAADIRDGRLWLRLEDVQIREGPVSQPAAAATAPPPAPGEEDLAAAAGEDLQVPRPETGAGPEAPDESGAVAQMPPERPVEGDHEVTYRRIRDRVASFLDRSLPEWLQPAVPWVLLLPDFVVLLARLVRDPAVSTRAKVVAGAALGYLALPADILPDFIPGLGVLDDVALAVFALEALVGMSPPEVVQRHWPGSEDVLEVVRQGLAWTARFFPRRFTDRLRRWLQEKEKPDR